MSSSDELTPHARRNREFWDGQSEISRCADSGESEPWMRLFGIDVA